jgi:NAD(P)-dependent dehydrogenase (short-subunit alcohol dehydrogenase family)
MTVMSDTPDLAIVTGTSGGIGAAVASTLRAGGLEVIGISRSAAPETTLRVDLGDLDALRSALAPLVSGRRVRTIVHSAALQTLGAAGTVSADEWLATLRPNVIALDVMVGVALDGLKAAEGAVIAISSVHGTATSRAIAVYAATKGAVEAWTRAAAIDLGPEITVNALAVGATDTPMLWAHLDPNGPEARTLVERTPAKRIADPQEIADLVAYLAGPSARFITGSVYRIDGGALSLLGTE